MNFMQKQKAKAAPAGTNPSEQAVELEIPDPSSSLAALDAAIAEQDTEREAKKLREQQKEERRKCCGLAC